MGHFVSHHHAIDGLRLCRCLPRPARPTTQDLLPNHSAQRHHPTGHAPKPGRDQEVAALLRHCHRLRLYLRVVPQPDVAYVELPAITVLYGAWQLDCLHFGLGL